MNLEKQITELIAEVEANWQIEVIAAIKKKIQDIGLVDTGNLADSIKSEAEGDNLRFTMAEYGKFQDAGVNPDGQKLYNTEFSFKGKWQGTAQALKSWALARDINPWAVAWSLQFITGIKPKNFFSDTIESMQPLLGERIEDIIIQKLEFETKKYGAK